MVKSFPVGVAAIPLFSEIPEATLTALLSEAQPEPAAAHAAFFHQDDPADGCFLLLSGYVKLSQIGAEGEEMVLRFIKPGQIFGWVAVMHGDRFPATALAMTDCQALKWDGGRVRRAVLEEPRLGLNALRIVGHRLRETQERLREVATERTERRLAHALLRLADQIGRTRADGIDLALPVSRQVLADMTGATLHTVSRLLAGWRQAGLIGGGRQHIVVRDAEALRRLAET